MMMMVPLVAFHVGVNLSLLCEGKCSSINFSGKEMLSAETEDLIHSVLVFMSLGMPSWRAVLSGARLELCTLDTELVGKQIFFISGVFGLPACHYVH